MMSRDFPVTVQRILPVLLSSGQCLQLSGLLQLGDPRMLPLLSLGRTLGLGSMGLGAFGAGGGGLCGGEGPAVHPQVEQGFSLW